MSKVGVCQVDVTPPLGMEFIGYHRPSGITNVDERIYATAFVFEKEQEKSIIVSVDNIGMLIEDTRIIRTKIAEELALSIDKITVLYTHTHSGPATASKDPLIQAYKKTLIANIVKSALVANSQVESAEIGWGVTTGDIGVNRREETPNGKVIMGTNENGVVDDRIGVLGIKKKASDEYIGVIVFCTAHPNVLKSDSTILSGDYPGLAKKILGNTLNCPIIIVQGAAGNVNAKYRGTMGALKKMAYALSGNVLQVVPTLTYNPITKLKSVSNLYRMSLKEIPEPIGIEEMAKNAEEQWGVNTQVWLNTLIEKYNKNQRNLSIDLELQLIQLNEGSFSGIPMEPFSEMAIDIKNKLKNEMAFFGGYTNGYLGYLPIKEAYPYGGYEVELNPVVYGPITNLWMPPVEETAEEVVEIVLSMYRDDNE